MKLEVGDVKSFTLISGMEVIGKVLSMEDNQIEIGSAFAVSLQPAPDGQGVQVGFAPLSPFIRGPLDLTLYKYTLLLAVDPPEALLQQYATQTGSIIAPPRKKIIA